MPLGPGVRYRVKRTKSGKMVRLAFRGNKVVEATRMKKGNSMQTRLAGMIRDKKFSRKGGKPKPSTKKY